METEFTPRSAQASFVQLSFLVAQNSEYLQLAQLKKEPKETSPQIPPVPAGYAAELSGN